MGRFIEVALLLVALGRVDGVRYLLTNVQIVYAVAGESEGFFQIDIPQVGYNATTHVVPNIGGVAYTLTTVNVTEGVETKAFVLHVIGNDISITVQVDSGMFSPLPISALGSRYVVSTYMGSTDRVMLVIANYNQKTDVDITLRLEGNVTYNNMTYNDGDTIHVNLDEYQTFTLKSAYDLTGTVINTTRDVAVFSGTIQKVVRAVAQLLPVRHHETEFVMFTHDASAFSTSPYQLQVVSDHGDTDIMLNNGSTFSLGENRVYRQNLGFNRTLYFNTTRPVMATLYRESIGDFYQHGFVVVTPVKYFIDTAQVRLVYSINILTKQHVTDIEAFSSDMTPVTVDWVDIPGSDYKAGKTGLNGHCYVRSTNRFALYGFVSDIFNGGFRFQADPSTTQAATGSTTESTNDMSPESTPSQSPGEVTSCPNKEALHISTPSRFPVGVFLGGVAAGAVVVTLGGLTAYFLVVRRRYNLTTKKQSVTPASVEQTT